MTDRSQVSQIRLLREFEKCTKEFKGVYEIALRDDNVFEWIITILPFDRERYGKESYIMRISIPSSYPFSAPLVKIEGIFHPNVDKTGKMCLGMISEWKSTYGMRFVLESVLTLLKEPNLEDPVHLAASRLWRDVKSFSKRTKAT